MAPDGEEAPRERGPLWAPELLIERLRIPRDKLVGRSRPGRYSHVLDELYRTNALPPTARRSRIGVLYAPRPDGTADMHIVINGEDMGPSARGLPAARPLYAVVDVFASTKSVRVIQVEYGRGYLPPWAQKRGGEEVVTPRPHGQCLSGARGVGHREAGGGPCRAQVGPLGTTHG